GLMKTMVPGHSYWLNYIGVADVDAKTKEAESLGAKVVSPPIDIPNVGRSSALQDPTGVHFALFQPKYSRSRPPSPPPPPTPRHQGDHDHRQVRWLPRQRRQHRTRREIESLRLVDRHLQGRHRDREVHQRRRRVFRRK